MGTFRDLTVYKKAFEASMMVYRLSKRFPKEETYSLTDQIRRSSRSVCVNFAEAYRKRRYPAHFISKLTDVDGENTETQVWLDYAVACDYVTTGDVAPIRGLTEEVGLMLGSMIDHPEKWTTSPTGKPGR